MAYSGVAGQAFITSGGRRCRRRGRGGVHCEAATVEGTMPAASCRGAAACIQRAGDGAASGWRRLPNHAAFLATCRLPRSSCNRSDRSCGQVARRDRKGFASRPIALYGPKRYFAAVLDQLFKAVAAGLL